MLYVLCGRLWQRKEVLRRWVRRDAGHVWHRNSVILLAKTLALSWGHTMRGSSIHLRCSSLEPAYRYNVWPFFGLFYEHMCTFWKIKLLKIILLKSLKEKLWPTFCNLSTVQNYSRESQEKNMHVQVYLNMLKCAEEYFVVQVNVFYKYKALSRIWFT